MTYILIWKSIQDPEPGDLIMILFVSDSLWRPLKKGKAVSRRLFVRLL